VLLVWLATARAGAVVLWSDPDPRVIHNTVDGTDLLAGAVMRDDTARDALYFKLRVDPLSDVANEEYYAVFQLFQGNQPRLAVGNAPEAWGYSAFCTSETGPFNKVAGEFNLKSGRPEAAGLGASKPYELPRHNQQRTLVFRVQYIPGGDDLVTVWLDPKLDRGATEENQPEILTTKFKADASFDQVRLRHEGGGNGWIFSDMAIGTSFSDFVVVRFWQTWWFTSLAALVILAGVSGRVRMVERRRYQQQLRTAEQERALERERARIAQDLHDDLGSSLTRITLLCDQLLTESDGAPGLRTQAGKISQSAAQTVQALEEIVWAVRPGSDTLQGLVDYVAHVSSELFEGSPTRCRLDLPHDLPDVPLPPELRHNIFLIVKEALTNVLKHSSAREVYLQAKATPNQLEFVVRDDGQGFDPAQAAQEQRNGLSNMRRRAQTIGGTLTVDSSPAGTQVRLAVPVGTQQRKVEMTGGEGK
jgi:signal transduction histidine kinase